MSDNSYSRYHFHGKLKTSDVELSRGMNNGNGARKSQVRVGGGYTVMETGNARVCACIKQALHLQMQFWGGAKRPPPGVRRPTRGVFSPLWPMREQRVRIISQRVRKVAAGLTQP